MFESRITAKGQTTLPRQVRAALDVQPGDQLRYVVLDGEVRILKARPVAALAGMLARPGQGAVSLDEMEAAVASGAAERGAG